MATKKSRTSSPWMPPSGHQEVPHVVTLDAAIRFPDVRITLEIELVDDTPGPKLVLLALIQAHVRVEAPLARLPSHEVVHRLVQRPCGLQQFPGPGLRDDVRHGGPNVLCPSDD